MGRSRPSDELAEEDLACACGVNVAAQGFRICATLARNSGLKLGSALGDVIVASMSSWLVLGFLFDDVIVN